MADVKIADISTFVSMALSAHQIDESHVTGVDWKWRYQCGQIVEIALDTTAPVRAIPRCEVMPFTCSGGVLIAYTAQSLISGVWFTAHEPMVTPVEHTEEAAKTTSGVKP